jgi:hypothetical protein
VRVDALSRLSHRVLLPRQRDPQSSTTSTGTNRLPGSDGATTETNLWPRLIELHHCEQIGGVSVDSLVAVRD